MTSEIWDRYLHDHFQIAQAWGEEVCLALTRELISVRIDSVIICSADLAELSFLILCTTPSLPKNFGVTAFSFSLSFSSFSPLGSSFGSKFFIPFRVSVTFGPSTSCEPDGAVRGGVLLALPSFLELYQDRFAQWISTTSTWMPSRAPSCRPSPHRRQSLYDLDYQCLEGVDGGVDKSPQRTWHSVLTKCAAYDGYHRGINGHPPWILVLLGSELFTRCWTPRQGQCRVSQDFGVD